MNHIRQPIRFPALFCTMLCLLTSAPALAAEPPRPLPELQRDLVNLRFGMFIHFSPTSYLDPADHLHPDHAPPRQGKDGILGSPDDLSPALLNPAKLNCAQWADAAKSAGMKFAVLTTKHHDGFCNWPSKYSDYTIAQGCKRDIVREFVDAFRSRGLKVGLYYSIRDRTAQIADSRHDGASPEKIQLIKNQLTELLTNYGDILYIVFDGWGNTWHESPTFVDIPYATIYNHIKSLQPNCLILNHSRLRYVSDVPHIELRAGVKLPPGADWPAVGGDTLQSQWFWRKTGPASSLKSVDWIVNQHIIPYNQRNIVFQLNCAPNRDGLMDDNVVARLAEVGKAFTPPAPLTTIPDSWKNWPTPASLKLFTGPNLAKNKPARAFTAGTIKPAPQLTDADPATVSELTGPNAWWEIDLGQASPIAGLHLWNRPVVQRADLDSAQIFISEKPFPSDDPAALRQSPGVTTLDIPEPPGYPAPYPVHATGRYIRIVPHPAPKLSLAEIEIFAQTP